MQLADKEFAEFKAICDKNNIVYETEAEYRESANNLLRYVELSYELAKEHFGWEQRLKNEPKGFTIPSEGRTCSLCYKCVNGEVWYDKWGMKCMNCQTAYTKKIIPGYVFKDRDNSRHVTDSQLHWKFGLHPQTIKKLVRIGKLRPRQVPNGPMIFLKTENPDLPNVISEAMCAKR